MKKNVRNTLRKLAAAESAFVGSQFLAPVVRGHGVVVKIAAVRCTLAVEPADFHGWGVFRAVTHSTAAIIRKASEKERRDYLRLFPSINLIVCSADTAHVRATPANLADDRFHFPGPVDVQLPERIGLFDTMKARFDGSRFWFDQLDPRADPAAAAYLRRELAQMVDPKDIQRPGLTKGHRLAYAVEYSRRAMAILANQRNQADARLTLALQHAGAILCDFTDADDTYRVTFTVDGQRHTSVVRKGDLTVHSAGICLAGRDHDFDLSSLVGVLREGETGGRLFRF
jgi:hypothetical protein